MVIRTKDTEREMIISSLSELFGVLSEGERAHLLACMTRRLYRKGEIIYREGDIPRQLLCLVTGKAKVYKDGVGRSQIVRVVKPVGYFGYRAAFSGQAYITEAAALEPALIVKFPLALVERFIRSNTQLAWFFIRQLAQALGSSDERTVALTQKHVRARLADSILYLLECYGTEPDGMTLCSRLSREDMANLSNMTTSNAIRTLSVLQQEGLVNVDGRRISILDVDELRHVSEIG
ncbi:MAG: Crp/Fnr family transcriptional regulator [Bacteroidaceae bacterium]|nr:Crp/Fnr family transcriptional regulator [Bacteroidaceae bacterium]